MSWYENKEGVFVLDLLPVTVLVTVISGLMAVIGYFVKRTYDRVQETDERVIDIIKDIQHLRSSVAESNSELLQTVLLARNELERLGQKSLTEVFRLSGQVEKRDEEMRLEIEKFKKVHDVILKIGTAYKFLEERTSVTESEIEKINEYLIFVKTKISEKR